MCFLWAGRYENGYKDVDVHPGGGWRCMHLGDGWGCVSGVGDGGRWLQTTLLGPCRYSIWTNSSSTCCQSFFSASFATWNLPSTIKSMVQGSIYWTGGGVGRFPLTASILAVLNQEQKVSLAESHCHKCILLKLECTCIHKIYHLYDWSMSTISRKQLQQCTVWSWYQILIWKWTWKLQQDCIWTMKYTWSELSYNHSLYFHDVTLSLSLHVLIQPSLSLVRPGNCQLLIWQFGSACCNCSMILSRPDTQTVPCTFNLCSKLWATEGTQDG